jgi:hypothetical protein
MVIFILVFSIVFLIYGVITKNSKDIPVFYIGLRFYENKYFIKSKYGSHIINFIYSLMIAYFLYFKFISNIWILTIPLLYFLVIYLSTKLYKKG